MYGYRYGFYGFDLDIYTSDHRHASVSCGRLRKLRSTFAKYRGVRNASGLTGAEAVGQDLKSGRDHRRTGCEPSREVLRIIMIQEQKTVSLSQDIYGQTSLAAVGVAAHECGHAHPARRALCAS